ncbi:hypothetical protein EYV94_05460 [Puteibacter caeruleilacunae]|nr:hypothetical protein EYV94_05460 [Puteibacter caeruleilacunae]
MQLSEFKMSNTFLFSKNTMMADVIHRDYRLIPIIDRFGINFGFGNKTIEEVCFDYQLDTSFFLAIINSYHNPNYFPQLELQSFSTELIIQYLSNTHAYYLDEKMPEIQGYISQMQLCVIDKNVQNIKLIDDFLKGYEEELRKHLQKEDNNVFPYIMALEQAFETRKCSEELIQQIKTTPIETYERNHDNVEEKLSDLKNLILKFLTPVSCKAICQRLLTELFRLESDLENHTRIEENVLVPKVKLLEQQIIETLS